MRSTKLPKEHYASSWQKCTKKDFHAVAQVNELGRQYKEALPGPAHELIGHELVRNFHNYISKYLAMICEGKIMLNGGFPNKDSVNLLKFFLPKDSSLNKENLNRAAKNLHLAFKQMDTGEIYDVLAFCLLQAVNKYDPTYADKVHRILGVLNAEMAKTLVFTAAEVVVFVQFDSTRYLRLLKNKEFLASSRDAKTGIISFERGPAWPPPVKFLESGPVGLTYFVAKWFRYFLQDYINKTMSQLEAKEHVFQLDYRGRYSGGASGMAVYNDLTVRIPEILNVNGAFVDAYGRAYHADVRLMHKNTFDIGEMNLAWVKNASGPCGALTNKDRLLLYMVFVREMEWSSISRVFQIPARKVKFQYEELMVEIRALFDLETVPAATAALAC